MYPVLMVACVTVALALSSEAKGECPCFPFGRYVDHMICKNRSLTSIPDCVPSNITALTIRTPSIPLVPETIRRFTDLRKLNIEDFDNPQLAPNFLDGHIKISFFKIYGTSLQRVDGKWFTNTPNVMTLILSHNKIKSLDPNVFSSLKALDSVALDHNKLTTLPPTLFKGTALKVLHIEENPFRCDCELPTFIKWTKDNGVNVMEPTFCINPLELRRVNLLDLPQNENCKS